MTTTTNVKQTKLNIMTQAQYNSATKNATELYMVTDAQISYNDLTDKPTIPTVNNATLTITQGGTTKGTFTANASSDVTIALDAGGGGGSLPDQTGKAGLYLQTDGTDASWQGVPGRNLFEDVTSDFELTDAALHLKDGSLIQYGIYQDFVDEVALKSVSEPNKFTTEALWQAEVTATGYCNKYVYDSVNNTVRLPKWGNQTIHTMPSTLGVKGNGMTLGLSDGTHTAGGLTQGSGGGSIRLIGVQGQGAVGTSRSGNDLNYEKFLGVPTDSTKSGIVTETNNIGDAEVYHYVVIATSVKTDVQADIDQIATDLNGKADADLVNLNNTGKGNIVHNSLPSTMYDNLTLGASAASYTAPADGWVFLYGGLQSGTDRGFGLLYNATTDYRNMSTIRYINYGNIVCWMPVRKGDSFQVHYQNYTNVSFRFYYANGNNWEAQ